MTVRRTSLYTLHLPSAIDADRAAAALTAVYGRGLQDHGPMHIGFRATDDTAATQVATAALEAAGLADVHATLTTGLGVHQRYVAVQDAAA